jgi:hypothetical protein
MTSRTGLAEQDSQNRIGRLGQVEQDMIYIYIYQNRIGRTELAE